MEAWLGAAPESMALRLVIVFGVVAVINLVPAFMPATWTVLVAFQLRWTLPAMPLVMAGAVAATLGRYLLARAVARYGLGLLPRRLKENLGALGQFVDRSPLAAFWSVLGLTIAPLPSNELFIGAGLAGASLIPISLGFFVSRLITYGLAVGAVTGAGAIAGDLFAPPADDRWALARELLSWLLFAALAFIPWGKLLRRRAPANSTPAVPEAPPGATR